MIFDIFVQDIALTSNLRLLKESLPIWFDFCCKEPQQPEFYSTMSKAEIKPREIHNMRELVNGTKKRQKGFTLIEVIIVVAIIGILAAIAVPSFLSWLPNMRLKAASRDLYGHMMQAKTEAIKSNTPTSFVFSSGTGSPCTGGSYTFSNSAGNLVNTTMENDVCLSPTSTFPNGFSAKGTASGAIGSVILAHPKSSKTYKITQTIAGGISIH